MWATMTAKSRFAVVLYLLIYTLPVCLSISRKETRKKAEHSPNHASNIAKKQQVLIPMTNFASQYGQVNGLSPISALDGNNGGQIRNPTNVFLRGGDQAYIYSTQISQRGDNEESIEAPFTDNYEADTSLFNNDIYNDYNDNHNDNVNADENVESPIERVQASPYVNAEATNSRYYEQAEENQQPNREETISDVVKNYGINNKNMDSNIQEIPSLAKVAMAKVKAMEDLYSLDQKHEGSWTIYYRPFLKQLLSDKVWDNQGTATKKESQTNPKGNVNKTLSETGASANKSRDEEKEKMEYKKIVKSAELASNLAEAARTLTKLITKLTSVETATNKFKDVPTSSKKSESQGMSHNDAWSPWSAWSECSQSCGGGLKYTKRNCNTISDQDGQRPCKGRRIKVRVCNTGRCKNSTSTKVNLKQSLSEMATTRSFIYKRPRKIATKVTAVRPSKP